MSSFSWLREIGSFIWIFWRWLWEITKKSGYLRYSFFDFLLVSDSLHFFPIAFWLVLEDLDFFDHNGFLLVDFVELFFNGFFLLKFCVLYMLESTDVVDFLEILSLFEQIINILLPCIPNRLDLRINLVNSIMKFVLAGSVQPLRLCRHLRNNCLECHLYTLLVSSISPLISLSVSPSVWSALISVIIVFVVIFMLFLLGFLIFWLFLGGGFWWVLGFFCHKFDF